MSRRPLLGALVGDPEIEALFSDDADLAAMLRVEAALAEAEAAAGLVAPASAARIAEACRAFVPDWAALARGIAQDGVVVPALVTQLRAGVGDPHADAVHKGATSQDIIDTSLVLRLKDVVAIANDRLAALRTILADLSRRDGAIPLMAHTRMQVALPITVAGKLRSWLAPLERHAGRLAEIAPRLLVLQLGGPVGTRAEFGAAGEGIAAAMARTLGLGDAPPWHAQRDGVVEFGSWLALVSGTLGKLGQDVALMAQNEVGAVALAGGGTSSAMAHKQNPVSAELLVALARLNAGLAGTLNQSLVHENERSGAAWTLEWMVLPQMVVATGAGLRIALALVGGLSFTAPGSMP